jgi:hypothetical protein
LVLTTCTFGGVPFAFAAVEVFAAALVLGFGQLLLGAIDEDFLELRVLLEQLFEGTDSALPFAATTTSPGRPIAAAGRQGKIQRLLSGREGQYFR